ncbi:MAG TPA: hypothetical protein VG722_07485 [Tepidisphaeraceae bacterium]|nr:hypothetical protein [Tepidisphaeraceae bacterium]
MTQTNTGKSTGYEVGKPQGQCAITGRPIQPGEKFHAALRETPTGFERLDVSSEAWTDFSKNDLLASWQTTMPAAQVKKKVFVDDEVLLELFERLADATEPSKVNFRFVLGLILMRKRLLVYENTRMDGEKEFWTVRRRGRDDRMDLLNPRLDEQQITEVSQQLSQILNEEL